jgi:hypothetical protein
MERILDGFQVVQFIQRTIKDRRSQILDLLEAGNLTSMEQYKYLMGETTALTYISQELSGLLEQQEQQND